MSRFFHALKRGWRGTVAEWRAPRQRGSKRLGFLKSLVIGLACFLLGLAIFDGVLYLSLPDYATAATIESVYTPEIRRLREYAQSNRLNELAFPVPAENPRIEAFRGRLRERGVLLVEIDRPGGNGYRLLRIASSDARSVGYTTYAPVLPLRVRRCWYHVMTDGEEGWTDAIVYRAALKAGEPDAGELRLVLRQDRLAELPQP